MIDFFCDQVARRVVVRDETRILGALHYQIQTPSGWLNAITVEREGNRVRAELGGAGVSKGSPVIEDRFSADGDELVVIRRWLLPHSGLFRLLFDYRSHEEGIVYASLPGVTYAGLAGRSPTPVFGAPLRLLSMPGAVYGGEDDLFALSVGDSTAIPEGGSIHLYESEQRGAIQVRFPGTRVVTERAPSAVSDDAVSQSDQEWVSSRSVREPEVAFRLFLNQEHVGAALLHMASRVWREVETVLPKDVPDLEEFRQEKLRYINRHVIKARGAARAIRPADDDRRKQPPPIIAGLGPYWSLLGARVFIQEGRRTGGVAYTDEGMSICDFFLKGKRPDGLIHDAYDPEKKHWGTLTASGFVSGVASLSSSAEAARHFLEIFAELRGSGVTRPELARLAGDTGDVLIDSRGDNGLWYESGEAALSTATVLTLLVRLESIRGRNSVRRTAIKQAASPFMGLLNTDSAVEQVASDRASLTTVCRAILDLGFYLRDDASLRAASEYAGLLASWVAAGGHSFPPGSRARKARLTTVGLVGCSKDRPHLGFDGLPVAYELARASKLTGHDQLASIAKAVCASTRQCLGGHSPIKKIALGAQPAELDITDWSSRRRNSRATGSLLGARVEQSIQAAFSATLLLEHYPDIANSR